MAKFKFKFDFKKIDYTPIKKFLIARGEKIALGLAVIFGAMLVGRGLIAAKSAPLVKNTSTRMIDQLRADVDQLRDNMKNAVFVIKESDLKVKSEWSGRYDIWALNPYFSISEKAESGRSNPLVLPMANRAKNVKIDYLLAGVSAFEINLANSTATVIQPPKASEHIAKTVRPKRIMIVNALFPLKEQLEEFVEKLKISRPNLLNSRDEMPHFLGVNVQRIIKDAQDKEDWTNLYKFNPAEEKLELAEHLANLFKEAEFLEEGESFQQFQKHRHPGLMCNLPKLIHACYPHQGASYPKLEPASLDGIDLSDFVKPVPPKKDNQPPVRIPTGGRNPPPVEVSGTIKTDVSWLDEPIKSSGLKRKFEGHFEGDYQIFDMRSGTAPQPKPIAGKPGIQPVVAVDFENIPDALIRFIDCDVVPGNTYLYRFQVRLANPNYNRTEKDLVSADDAKPKELTSAWNVTEEITVPPEMFYYVIDQKELDGPEGKTNGPDLEPLDGRKAPLQFHRFVESVPAPEGMKGNLMIADWVVVERFLVGRGEYLGRGIEVKDAFARRPINVLVPTWDLAKGAFEVLNPPGGTIDGKPAPIGIPVPFPFENLSPTKTPPMLVDFSIPAKRDNKVEPSAMDLLLLTPDGKLEVHNTGKEDPDPTVEARLHAERLGRLNEYRERWQKTPTAVAPAPPPPKKKGPMS